MSLLPDDKKEGIRNEFKEKLIDPVKIVMFTQEVECKFCSDTRQLVQEIATLSDKISVEIYDFLVDVDKVKMYGVDKIPALALIGEKDYGVRIYGIPYGYELQALIDALVIVSIGKTNLSDKTKTILADIKSPVHIQVFVSLTCPHCSAAATIANKLAVENDFIRTDIIDASEFPHLTQKYAVMGVPKIVINEKVEFTGAFNEDLFAEYVVLGAYQI
jgi:glutaredoxin-like protein